MLVMYPSVSLRIDNNEETTQNWFYFSGCQSPSSHVQLVRPSDSSNMFSLNLPVNDEAGSRQASARRVAPLSSRKSSRQTLDEGKLFTSQSQDGHESTDDSSLDDFDLLYDSYSERSSNSNDSDSSDDSEDSEQGGRSIDSDGEDNRGSSEDRQDGGDDHDRSEHADGAADKAAEVVGRPPRLSLPALEVPTASVDGVRGLEPFESARRARCTANTDHATNSEVGEGLAKHTVNVELLTPCFELSISTGEDPARQVAQKFAVSQERVRVMMHDRERLAVQLLGSSFSLVKLEEKMAENASLHARVAELERKLASSESLRLKAHRTLQELRREVDALEEFVCTKR
jgi:hypothetical protein